MRKKKMLLESLEFINRSLESLLPEERAVMVDGVVSAMDGTVRLTSSEEGDAFLVCGWDDEIIRDETSTSSYGFDDWIAASRRFVSEVMRVKCDRFFSDDIKEQSKQIKKAMMGIFDQGTPAIGIDLDGTIDEAPGFFADLSHSWKGKVYIVTYRDDAEKAKADALRHGVRCDEVILVNSFEEKSKRISQLGIEYFFDDMDEVIQHVKPECKVFKVRNEGNFCFDSKKWLYSDKTGSQI